MVVGISESRYLDRLGSFGRVKSRKSQSAALYTSLCIHSHLSLDFKPEHRGHIFTPIATASVVHLSSKARLAWSALDRRPDGFCSAHFLHQTGVHFGGKCSPFAGAFSSPNRRPLWWKMLSLRRRIFFTKPASTLVENASGIVNSPFTRGVWGPIATGVRRQIAEVATGVST
jgi:hypothetical protein